MALVEIDPLTPDIEASTRTPATGAPLLSCTSTRTHACCPTTPLTLDVTSESDATSETTERLCPPV